MPLLVRIEFGGGWTPICSGCTLEVPAGTHRFAASPGDTGMTAIEGVGSPWSYGGSTETLELEPGQRWQARVEAPLPISPGAAGAIVALGGGFLGVGIAAAGIKGDGSINALGVTGVGLATITLLGGIAVALLPNGGLEAEQIE